MSFLDKAKAKLTKAVDDHGDKIADGIDKAGAVVNEKTGGKHADKIDQATGKARDALDSLDGKNDDIPPGTARPDRPGGRGPTASPSSPPPTSTSCARAIDGTEVLLQLRQGTPYMDGHWAAAAAGHVERGETAYDAAHREALEELGVTDVAWSSPSPCSAPSTPTPIDERVDWFFTARSWAGEPRVVEPEKCAEIRWCPLDALPVADGAARGARAGPAGTGEPT